MSKKQSFLPTVFLLIVGEPSSLALNVYVSSPALKILTPSFSITSFVEPPAPLTISLKTELALPLLSQYFQFFTSTIISIKLFSL